MSLYEKIKREIKELHKEKPNIHISVSMSGSRLKFENEPAKIKGAYPNIFVVEIDGKTYSFPYTDLMIKQVEISELNI